MDAEHTHTCKGIFLTVTVANNDETENLQAMSFRGTRITSRQVGQGNTKRSA
jgi:hypothetical protein